MKIDVVCIILMLCSVFYKQFEKLGRGKGDSWKFENPRTDKIVTNLLRIIVFLFALVGLIYSIING